MCRSLSLSLVAVLTAPAAAQGRDPALLIPALNFLPPGGANVSLQLQDGAPNAPYAVLADVHGGPSTVLGETFYLGFRQVVTLDAGALNGLGTATRNLRVPGGANLLGFPIYAQAAVIDVRAPNGVFRVSNGESLAFVGALRGAIIERFDDAPADGWTGNYDGSVRRRLQGGAVRRRTHSSIDPQGVLFNAPLLTPLNPNGNRSQFVFRPRDLGASGEEELLTAIRWRPFGGTPVQPDVFPRIEILAMHSLVRPDYTVDWWTALPRFPNSGLDPVFANNVRPGDTPVSLFSGSYSIQPGALRPDGYLPYPALTRPFAYDGVDSLLLEIKVHPSGALGLNGHEVRLMVQSSPRPNARVYAAGAPGAVIDPNTVTSGRGDNTLVDYQFEFVRVETTALSTWRAAPVSAPDYATPIVAASVPSGASYAIEYRGGDDLGGSNATAWSSSIDVADGRPFVQLRVTLTGDIASGAVPSIDTIAVPIH